MEVVVVEVRWCYDYRLGTGGLITPRSPQPSLDWVTSARARLSLWLALSLIAAGQESGAGGLASLRLECTVVHRWMQR